jgi:hypothetical protein
METPVQYISWAYAICLSSQLIRGYRLQDHCPRQVLDKSMTLSEKKLKQKVLGGGMAQVLEHLPRKCKILSLSPNNAERERERERN